MPRPLAQPIDHAELLRLSQRLTQGELAIWFNCHPQTIHKHLRQARAAVDPHAAYPVPRGWKRGSCHPNLPCWANCLDDVDRPCVLAKEN